MSDLVSFHCPAYQELAYRQQLLAQPETMAYNRGYHLKMTNYDNETGCIDFTEAYWPSWYERWLGEGAKNYYAYIMSAKDHKPVGEVALRALKEENVYCVNVVIEAAYRHGGFGEAATRLLVDMGFRQLNAEKLIDEFPPTRTITERLFQKIGFVRVSETRVELSKQEYLEKRQE
ncbi:MAG: GNAT family N-acetyltransferase [Sporolactobacillus sp.]